MEDEIDGLFHHHRLTKTVVCYSGILCSMANTSARNIQHLKEDGVPETPLLDWCSIFLVWWKQSPSSLRSRCRKWRKSGFVLLSCNRLKPFMRSCVWAGPRGRGRRVCMGSGVGVMMMFLQRLDCIPHVCLTLFLNMY